MELLKSTVSNPLRFMVEKEQAKSIVYGLVSPIDNRLFYVGATMATGVSSRLQHHIHDSKRKKVAKDIAIQNIVSTGLTISVMAIDYLPMGNRKERDAFEWLWIAHVRSLGYNLLNEMESPSQHPENYGVGDRYEVGGSYVRQVKYQYFPLQYISAFRAMYFTGMHIQRLCTKKLILSKFSTAATLPKVA